MNYKVVYSCSRKTREQGIGSIMGYFIITFVIIYTIDIMHLYCNIVLYKQDVPHFWVWHILVYEKATPSGIALFLYFLPMRW